MKYINHEITLDFPATPLLASLMEEAEEADKKESYEYGCIAEAIDVLGKQYYAEKRISKAQWELLCQRYPSD